MGSTAMLMCLYTMKGTKKTTLLFPLWSMVINKRKNTVSEILAPVESCWTIFLILIDLTRSFCQNTTQVQNVAYCSILSSIIKQHPTIMWVYL